MTRLQAIIAAVDFSAGSEAALVRAADLAGRTGAALHLLHGDVLFRSSGEGAPPEGASSSALRLRVERLATNALGATSDALDGIGPTVAVVRDVTAPAAILRYAASVEADLLVMGTHGRSGVARLLLGSVAEACVAAAPCPVLTVPHQAGPRRPSPEAPVLVPVDFAEGSRAALVAGRALADLYDASVELVHIVRDAGPYPGFAPDVLSIVDVDPAQGEAVRERLSRFAASVPGVAPSVLHAAIGSPARVIAALAAERGAGAIVMGTHGRSGVAHAFVGSAAEATLRRAPCSVLTLKEGERLGAAPRPVASALSS